MSKETLSILEELVKKGTLVKTDIGFVYITGNDISDIITKDMLKMSEDEQANIEDDLVRETDEDVLVMLYDEVDAVREELELSDVNVYNVLDHIDIDYGIDKLKKILKRDLSRQTDIIYTLNEIYLGEDPDPSVSTVYVSKNIKLLQGIMAELIEEDENSMIKNLGVYESTETSFSTNSDHMSLRYDISATHII